jgi:DNA-binding CsgD family transcriptional regulator
MLSNQTADLLTILEKAQTFDGLWSATANYLENLGVTHSIYTFVQPRDPTTTRAWTSLPAAWCRRYLDQGYYRIDPFYRYCCRSFAPVGTGPDYLDDHDFLNEQERRIVFEGGETGFRSGFSSPVRLLGEGGFGGWNFGSSLPRRQFETLLTDRGRDLRLAGFYIHEHAGRLSRLDDARQLQRQPQQARLSTRERECLLWLSRGLRTLEIAERLGIAAVTVDLHFKNARRKLNASTREEALAKAIRAKFVHP